MTDFTRHSTGIPGLDNVLHGGLITGRNYLIRGRPGTGKTILGLHYLTAGVEAGESALFINLEESTEDVKQNAASMGFDLDGLEFLDLSPDASFFTEEESYDIFAPGEVEGGQMAERIVARVQSVAPDRVFVDPMTQLRHLSPDEYQFRKQAIGFARFLEDQGATALFSSQASVDEGDEDLQFLVDGVIELDRTTTGRSLTVPKFRGSNTEGGIHSLRLTDEGVRVYPRLSPGEHRVEFEQEPISSGVPEMDELLHGGIERGTVTVISGPTGVGKTTTGSQFMKEASGRGERSAIYMFEESEKTFFKRCRSVNIPVDVMADRDILSIKEIDALDLSAAEFAQGVREDVEEGGVDIVMIDGIAGYRMVIEGEQTELLTELQRLCRYLKNMGVTVILIEETANVIGEFEATTSNISYLADNIVFLRHLELEGELRKVIGVLKKRVSDFEHTLREFEITQHGVKVGEPLTNLRGILSGSPEWVTKGGDRDDG